MMAEKLIIVLQSNYVARWFSETLDSYVKSRDIEITFVCRKKIKPGKSSHEKWIPKKISRLWEASELKNCRSLDFVDINETMLCFCGSEKMQSSSQRHSVFIVENGSSILAPGLNGWFNFFHQFFWLGKPMVIADSKESTKYSVYFQTRDFKLSRNVGFLRFNIDKILDFLIFKKRHGYPNFSESDEVRFPIQEYIRYPFWQLSQKIKRKVFKANWQLIKMSRKSLDRFSSVDESLIPLLSGQGWADPFIADSDKGLFLFFEEIVNGKGQLSVLELNRGSLTPQNQCKKVMERDTHMSYPFVFQNEGEWYMIPENSAADDLSIYKAEEFPYEWSHFKTVFTSSKWVDTTPFFYKNKWWIFSVKKEVEYASSYQDLHLFFCDDILRDNWQPHPANPIVSDVRHSRSGGPLFFYDDKLIRPAQNCHNKYGGGLQFCEVLELSEEKYEERVLGEFKFPVNKPMSSFHTIAVYGDQIIGDCYV